MDKLTQQFPLYKPGLLKRLANIEYAKKYLDLARKEYETDGDREAFLLALRDVAKAQGGLKSVIKQSDIEVETLYDVLDVLVGKHSGVGEAMPVK